MFVGPYQIDQLCKKFIIQKFCILLYLRTMKSVSLICIREPQQIETIVDMVYDAHHWMTTRGFFLFFVLRKYIISSKNTPKIFDSKIILIWQQRQFQMNFLLYLILIIACLNNRVIKMVDGREADNESEVSKAWTLLWTGIWWIGYWTGWIGKTRLYLITNCYYSE